MMFTIRPGTSDALVVEEVFHKNCYQFEPDYAKDGIIIDIGANIGAFSLLAGQYGKVMAYEPEPHNFAVLKENIKRNKVKNVIAHNVAIGQPNSVGSIQDLSGSSHLSFTGEVFDQSVTVLGLDEIVTGPIGFLKIDCEGSEYDIIKYASDATLNQVKRIAIEFHPWSQEYHNEILGRLTNFFDFSVTDHGLYLGVQK